MKITFKELRILITEEIANNKADELFSRIDSALSQLAEAERLAQHVPNLPMSAFFDIEDAMKILRKMRANTLQFRRTVQGDPQFASLEALRKDNKKPSSIPPANK